jgi:hypothetical protein
MMANPNKTKGSNFERRIVKEALKSGLEARKQPLSGILPDYPSDVVIEQTLVEAKTGYTRETIKDGPVMSVRLEWLEKVKRLAKSKEFERGVLMIRPDGMTTPFVIMTLDNFLDLLKEVKGGKVPPTTTDH